MTIIKKKTFSLDDNNMNNVINNANNSKITILINNNTKLEPSTTKENHNFNIFTFGNYDNFSSNIISETYYGNKKGKKPKKKKKLFSINTKKPKKKKKNINQRKDNADNIRKKIKVNFHKTLKNVINKKLKASGSKYIFKTLPQTFVTNITKEYNKLILDLTLKEIFIKYSNEETKDGKGNHNEFVLNYLEKNSDICEKFNYNKIMKMKYYEIFDEYLLSKEFKIVISTLKEKGENVKYIIQYITKAYNLINFFRYGKIKKK